MPAQFAISFLYLIMSRGGSQSRVCSFSVCKICCMWYHLKKKKRNHVKTVFSINNNIVTYHMTTFQSNIGRFLSLLLFGVMHSFLTGIWIQRWSLVKRPWTQKTFVAPSNDPKLLSNHTSHNKKQSQHCLSVRQFFNTKCES